MFELTHLKKGIVFSEPFIGSQTMSSDFCNCIVICITESVGLLMNSGCLPCVMFEKKKKEETFLQKRHHLLRRDLLAGGFLGYFEKRIRSFVISSTQRTDGETRGV